MENLEIKHFNFSPSNIEGVEKDENMEKFNKELDKLTEQLVEDILNHKNGEFLGKGMSASVYLPEQNKEICFKIICYRETAGKGEALGAAIRDASRINVTTHILPHDAEQGYLLPDYEGEFFSELHEIKDDVSVPRPFSSATYIREDWGKGYMIKEHIHILGMERLNAISLEDILEGKAKLPAKYDHDAFFVKLRKFVKKMHEEQHVYHRDLHQGNIMVNIDTGNPHIIDFGKSTRDTEDEAYKKDYTDNRGKQITTTYKKDEDFIDEIEKMIKELQAAQEPVKS